MLSMKKSNSLLGRLSFGSDSKSVEEIIENPDRKFIAETIGDLYEKIDNMSGTVLEEQHVAELPIRIAELDLTNQGSESFTSEPLSFFKPMSDEVYKGYTIFEKEDAADEIDICDEDTTRFGLIGIADTLCCALAWFMNCAHRNEIPKDEYGFMSTLGGLTGWLFQHLFDYGIDVNYFHRIFNSRRTIPETNYLGHWRRYPDADTKKKPHHMVVISIGLEKEEKLLQQEILVILAAMKGRLQDARLKKHVVFPIMLFSFLGEYGRVIQAYHDGQNLVIQKSRLISFRAFTATSMDLFVRHVANTPVGDTQRLPKQVPRQANGCAVHSNVETGVHQERPNMYSIGLPKGQSIKSLVIRMPRGLKRKWGSVLHRHKHTGKRAVACES